MASKVTASVTNARPRLSVVLVDAVIDSSSVVPVVSASSVRPAASADYVAPTAAITVVIPATEIAYISLAFAADIDISGLFAFKIDSVAMQDGATFSFSKSPSDLFVVADGTAYLLSKLLVDSISLEDVILTTLIFIREFSDALSIADETVLSFEQALYEYVYSADLLSNLFEKATAESVVATDLFIRLDSKSQNSLATIYDAEQKTFQKTRTDSVGTLDSGFVLQQNYIDLTYFSEDYVGVGYTF